MDDGHGRLRRMGEREGDIFDAQPFRKLQGAAREMQGRPLAGHAPDLHLRPRHAVVNAGSQCFGSRLFRSEPGGKTLCEVAFSLAISDLARSEDAFEKSIVVPLNRLSNPPDLYHVDPGSDQHIFEHVTTPAAHAGTLATEVPVPAINQIFQPSDQQGDGQRRLMNWDLKLSATSLDDTGPVLRLLTGAIVGHGGWVLSRTLFEDGGELDFEFERRACVDIYTLLVAAGLELSRSSHLQLTDLCHCTRNVQPDTRFDIARVLLKIYPDVVGTALAELGLP